MQQANRRPDTLRPLLSECGACGPVKLHVGMPPQQKAESLGLVFEAQTPGYLNLCIRSGNQLITSGHVSSLKGKLGAGVTVEDGYAAARECVAKILNSVWNAHGTLDGLRVLKVLGCVNSAPEFIEQHLVINGASDLLHEIFGKTGDGYHARSALGFASLPTGAAVEVEAVFGIL
jgi:enamine deaminase RidA (YjgF/YER057c/UK114 family)